MAVRLVILVCCFSGFVLAETNSAFRMAFPRWGPSVRGGSVYNFETDLDRGGSFSVNRYFIEAGMARLWGFERMVAVSAGFGQDDYNFGGLAAEPWNNIDNYRLGLFARWAVGNDWVLFAGPSVRSYGETGTDLDDALTGSMFAGASYSFGDRLTLGPGVVVSGQIEESTRFFPVLLVNWNVTERLSVETGGGLAATAGPGLALVYKLPGKWKAGVAARYEKKRFRLAPDNEISPNGVGEDRNVPVVFSLAYFLYPSGSVGVVFGYNFEGNLSISDGCGRNVYSSDYDPSLDLGFVASFRF